LSPLTTIDPLPRRTNESHSPAVGRHPEERSDEGPLFDVTRSKLLSRTRIIRVLLRVHPSAM